MNRSTRPPRLDNRGETLISVLVTVGLISIVMSASAIMLNHLMKISKTITVKNGMENFVSEVRTAFGVGATCKLNLTGKSIPKIGGTDTVNLPNLKYLDTSGSSLGEQYLVELGANQNEGFRVASVHLAGATQLAPGIAIIRMRLTMRAEGIVGGDVITRSIPLQLSLDAANKITDCKALTTSGDINISAPPSALPGGGTCTGGKLYLPPYGHGGLLTTSPAKHSSGEVTLPDGFPTQTLVMTLNRNTGKTELADPSALPQSVFTPPGYTPGGFTCTNGRWLYTPPVEPDRESV